jgi:hypothetical protein
MRSWDEHLSDFVNWGNNEFVDRIRTDFETRVGISNSTAGGNQGFKKIVATSDGVCALDDDGHIFCSRYVFCFLVFFYFFK